MANSFLTEFGKAFVPDKIFNFQVRVNLRKYLLKAGINAVPYSFFGLLFWITAGITYFVFMGFFYDLFIRGKGAIYTFIASFLGWSIIQGFLVALFILSIYFYLNVKIFKRTNLIEKFLPDYLVLVSTNIKGGLSLEQSLWSAIRPEFGILSEEMTLVSKRVMTGNELSEALNELAEKYDSINLKRNLQLIIGEIKGGGKIVEVIDRVVETLKKTKSLKAEMAAATVSYIIFIGAIVIVISPGLFALSYQLLNIIIGFTSTLGNSLSSASSGLNLTFSSEIDTSSFKWFSIMALFTISVGASMIISIIEKGDIRNGLKYIPIFGFSSVFLYLVFMVVITSIFGGII